MLLPAAVIPCASCGGLVLRLPDDAGAADAGADADAGVSAITTPPTPPDPSGPCGTSTSTRCSREGLVCEFGTDFASACNDLTICDGGTLKPLAVHDTHCPTVSAGAGAGCPGYETAATAIDGGAACGVGTICDYPQGRCECAALPPALVPAWHCIDPGVACPAVRPRLGQPCTQEAMRCDYDACGVSPSFGAEICTGGAWVAAEPYSCTQ